MVRRLEQAGQPVPQNVLELAYMNPRFKKQREKLGIGRAVAPRPVAPGGGRGRGRGNTAFPEICER
jgi:hypothetical protein